MVFVPSILFSQTKVDEITSIVNHAKVLYDNGNVKGALSLVKDYKNKFEQVNGGKLLYHKLLGRFYAELSENDKSEKEFFAIISDTSINASEKDKAETYFGIASACLSRGDLRKAEETFLQSYQTQERINIIDKNLTKLVQGYVSSDNLKKEYDWRSVKRMLGSNDCAIEFMMIPSWEGDSINSDLDYYAAIIKSDSQSPILVKLCKESEIKSILGKSKSLPLNRYIANLYKWGTRTHGEKIYKKIWEPLEMTLKGVKNVYYSPVGVLNTISFNAIAKDTMYIGQKYNLFQLTSTSQIKQVKENNKAMGLSTALVYGGVLYDANENDLIAESRSYMVDHQTVWNVKDGESEPTRSGWGYLPGTKLEAEAIYSKLDSAGIHSTLISGVKANEESFKSKTNGYDLIHIATHGFFLADKKEVALNPFVQGLRSVDAEPNAMIRSGLLLAGANRTWTGIHVIPNIEDGILTAEEISNVNLSGTKLVVLSACETGLGEIKSSEGVFGLQRAFKLAGVQSLIMSLWKVDDNATMQLMNIFYGNWLGGMSKHDAFNNAIEKIREKYKSPYYWAAFIMLD